VSVRLGRGWRIAHQANHLVGAEGSQPDRPPIRYATDRTLLRAWERLLNADLGRDGQIGEPQEWLLIVNAEASHRQAAEVANSQRQSQFYPFATGLPIKGASRRAWKKS
jgi:hypothetical protein